MVVICLVAVHAYLNRPIEAESTIMVLGHGGMGVRSTFPLNSIASINKAMSYDIDGIELDVQFTADNRLVAFHDEILDSHTNCTGRVSEKRIDEMADCEHSTWFRKSHISLLSEVLDEIPDGATVSLDVKPTTRLSELTGELHTMIASKQRVRFLIESRDEQFITTCKRELPQVEYFLLCEGETSCIEMAESEDLDGISIDLKHLNDSVTTVIRERKLKLMIWGAGSAISNRQAAEFQPDIIQTDHIWSAVKILKEN